MARLPEPWLLEMLVCPQSRASLVAQDGFLYSTDPATRRRYAVVNGIPNMLIEESQVASEEEFKRVMQAHEQGHTES